MVESATVLTPEKEFLINEGIRRATKQFPQDIVRRWALGKTPKKIAEKTREPVETIYRVLKKMQQAINDELRLGPYGKKDDI